MTKLLPFTIIGISIGASLVYALNGDVRQAVYWLSAATLNLAVTL
jgi:uncharacterized membrane protein